MAVGTVKVIVVAYKRLVPLRILMDSFLVQTSPKWELHIVHDGNPPGNITRMMDEYVKDERIFFFQSKDRMGKWGHPNRRQMLEKISVGEGDYIVITNDDNYYVPHFIDKLRGQMCNRVGIIYYDMLHNYYAYEKFETSMAINHIDMGSFAVKADVAKKVGFKSLKFEADGIYASECAGYCRANSLEIVKVPGVLFVHN